MITIASFLTFTGFYAGYAASGKAAGTRWLLLHDVAKKHRKLFRIMGLALLLVSAVIWMTGYGVGAGSFLFTIGLMTFASMIVLLAPLQLWRSGWIIGLFFFVFLLEILSHY